MIRLVYTFLIFLACAVIGADSKKQQVSVIVLLGLLLYGHSLSHAYTRPQLLHPTWWMHTRQISLKQ
jgi:hypothetical protein